eukprot:TRINITY_DN2305_c0_g2_i4.p1 TRINITY_DN2305_c0_g2~~TRINITY_DN2305_c0_g2_i4.p1  ORF type:complete len:339 (+),score=88.76 TRINITY_DN2305_c0_g2_i4:408-1424(+)
MSIIIKFLLLNRLLRYMVFIVLIDIGIIATWWIVDHPEETTNIKVEDGFEVVEKTCEAGELFIIVVAYKVLLVIASCYLSFKIRHSPDRFNESKWIFLSTYNVVLVVAVVVPIILLLPLDPATDDLILCLGLIFAVTGAQIILVLPKLLSGIKKTRVYGGKSSTGTQSTSNGTTADSILASVDKLSTEELITELVNAKKQIAQLQNLTRIHRDKLMSYESQLTATAGGDSDGSIKDFSGIFNKRRDNRTVSSTGNGVSVIKSRSNTFVSVDGREGVILNSGANSRTISQSNGQGHVLLNKNNQLNDRIESIGTSDEIASDDMLPPSSASLKNTKKSQA